MASAAAVKKWPLVFQCFSPGSWHSPRAGTTNRRYASWTSAVASRVCPGFSCASFCAASLRSSS